MNTEYECDRTLLVQADFDGELDAGQAAALVQHRATCAHCQAVEQQLQRSRTLLRAAPRYAAPAKLHDMMAAARDPRGGRSTRGRTGLLPSGRRAGFVWASAAAAVVATILLWPRGPNLGDQLVSSHVRALQLESHLIDVASTDHHTVKPWFAGKLDFSPPVKQLESHGYVLKGGRIDVINGRTAAVMVYQAGRHIVDLYVWPTHENTSRLSATPIDGFNLRHWQDGGFTIVSISDMSSTELDRFTERWREST